MNANQLRAELRTKGVCFLFIPEIGTYIAINKASLIDALTEFIDDGDEELDAAVARDGDQLFIEDFGPMEWWKPETAVYTPPS